ncbi:MAG: protease HtpX [Bdellovibrionaceae bacterium]|nr:protease HtpX [Pseudobdellovibrionaceae bacterium]
MAKRVFLLIVVNLLVITTLTVVLALFGVGNYITPYGLDYQSLFAFCAVFGFGGAFISLALSRVMAKMMMGVHVIDPHNPQSALERDLLQTVYRLAQRAGLSTMPEVGIYDSPEVNAFATGPSKSRALVAVSSGLIQSMDSRAVEGVLGHELAHVANGDMVTMTLLQGIINTFVMFFARVAAWGISQALSGDRDRNRGPNPFVHYICVIVFQIAFSLLGAIVVNYFSRTREFRADKGGANVAGKEKMIHALQSLKRGTETVGDDHPSLATLKISGRAKAAMALFATHPSLDDRIAALQGAA